MFTDWIGTSLHLAVPNPSVLFYEPRPDWYFVNHDLTGLLQKTNQHVRIGPTG